MDDHDQGLAQDLKVLAKMMQRRQIMRWIAGATLLPVIGCGSDTNSLGAGGSAAGGAGAGGTDSGGGATSLGGATNTGGSTSAAGGQTSASCSKVPEETGGPYPGDGSNGPNALALSGIIRSDIRSSFASATGTADGVPLTVKLTVVGANLSCEKLAGLAVYIWHCDRDGNYSMYTIADQNYLRGVQETDTDGTVTFTTIFPACYSGRWPHIHFEVYSSLDQATSNGTKLATSQLAMPEATCNEVFATTGYERSVTNLTQVSLATDMVFSDGATLETPTMSGSVTDGYVAELTVAINA